jgi:hypothetical protein
LVFIVDIGLGFRPEVGLQEFRPRKKEGVTVREKIFYPERGCAESQPQQVCLKQSQTQFSKPSCLSRCCDWSATQSRSVQAAQQRPRICTL